MIRKIKKWLCKIGFHSYEPYQWSLNIVDVCLYCGKQLIKNESGSRRKNGWSLFHICLGPRKTEHRDNPMTEQT